MLSRGEIQVRNPSFACSVGLLKNLTDSEAFDTLASRLRRSGALLSSFASVPLATPENPALFEHVAEAGQPLYVASAMAAWREAGNLDSAIWVVCSQVKAQEVMQSELGVWGQEALFLPEYEWAGFEEMTAKSLAEASKVPGDE